MVKNSNAKGQLNTIMYTIDVAGVNTRAYIFKVKEMKSICIVTYGNGKYGIPTINCKTYKEIGNLK